MATLRASSSATSSRGSSGNAFTLGAGATSFGTGSGSPGSLADLKIVPGLAVMLAAGTVSAEAVR